MLELCQASVVVHLVLIVDNKWHDAVAEALAEENEATDTSIAVLEWVDALETPVVFCNGMYVHLFLVLIPSGEFLHLFGYFGRSAGFPASYLVC